MIENKLKSWILVLDNIENQSSELFKKVRAKLKISQYNLAKLLEVSDAHISLIESKKRLPSKKVLEKLYMVLNDRKSNN